MGQHWWVNHRQTAGEEIAGGFLWSPKTEAHGARSQFYSNMRRVIPGDLILSFANAKIGFVGIASDYAFSAPKPIEFGTKGSYWNTEGWLLPVDWQAIPISIAPKSILEKIKPLLPEKYSPINKNTGNGNQKAYLAKIGEPLFNLVATVSNFTQHPKTISILCPSDFREALNSYVQNIIVNDESLSTTEKDQLIKARRGQGVYRDNLQRVEQGCRLTGVLNPLLLIASHIKPWRSCTSSIERLDGFNGFLMTPHVDYLFDRGFISFADDGSHLISPRLSLEDFTKLGFKEKGVKPTTLHPRQVTYVTFHRNEIFMSD